MHVYTCASSCVWHVYTQVSEVEQQRILASAGWSKEEFEAGHKAGAAAAEPEPLILRKHLSRLPAPDEE